jgi:hypothetical protein
MNKNIAVFRTSVASSLLVLAGLLLPGAFCRAQSTDAYGGPIDLRNQRAYDLLFFTFAPEDGTSIAKGHNYVSADLAIANDMMVPASTNGEQVTEDFETQRLTVTAARGLGHGLQAGFTVPAEARDGGILDGLIEAYHGLLGVDHTVDVQDGRDSYPEYRSILKDVNSQGQTVVDQGSAFGLGDVSFELKQAVATTRHLSAAVRLGIKLPTGERNDLIGSGSVDGGIDFDFDYQVSSHFIAFGDVGEVWMGKDTKLPNQAKQNTLTMWGFAYRLSRRDSLIAQTDGSDVVYHTGNAHVDTKEETGTLAFRRSYAHGRNWTIGVSENGDIFDYSAPYLAGIGPDFTVYTGLSWTR